MQPDVTSADGAGEREAGAGTAERWVTMVGGTALGLAGLRLSGSRHGSWAAAALTALGGGLFLAGAAGVPVARTVRETIGTGALPGVAGLLPLPEEPTTTQAVVTIGVPPGTVFRYWRNFANLPRLMGHLERVDVLSDKDSLWIARGPGGVELRWRSTLDKLRENELITWHTVGEADLPHRGSFQLRPAPGDRGIEARLTLIYRPPAAAGGRAVSRLFGTSPEQQAREALRRLKRILETGELPTVEGQPHGAYGRMQEIRE